jgi:ABC-type glycerol-3-phosphate transport system permease component
MSTRAAAVRASVGLTLVVGLTVAEALQFRFHVGWVFWVWLAGGAVGLALAGSGLNGLRIGLGTRVVAGLLAVVLLAVLVIPFLLVIVLGSFEPTKDLLTGAHTIPPSFTLDAYRQLFGNGSIYGTAYTNSLIVATSTALITTLFALPGAYALASIRFPGRAAIGSTVMVAYMLPGIILLVPLVAILKQLQLVDTPMGMVLGHTAIFLPFIVWLAIGAFRDLDPDIEHVARTDGCGRILAFRKVLLPLTVPSVATTFVFAFVLSWNELMFAKVMYVSNTPMLAPTIVNYMDPINRVEPVLSAASFLASLPVLFLALLMQRYIIRNIGEGAVK